MRSGLGGDSVARRDVRDLLRQADVDVLSERRGDLVLKELSEAAMARIDAAQQLAFVEPEGEGVIGLTRPGFPRGLLTGEHDGQAIQVGDHAPIDGLVEREQPRLVGEQLADGDLLFAVLRELGPVRGDPLFVVEPAARVGEGEGHGGQALRGRVDEHHGVLLPRLARPLVPDAAPEVDDLLAAEIGAAGAAQLTPPREVLDERLAHRLEAAADVPVDVLRGGCRRVCECHAPWGCMRRARAIGGKSAEKPRESSRTVFEPVPRVREIPHDEGSFYGAAWLTPNPASACDSESLISSTSRSLVITSRSCSRRDGL